MSGFSAELLSAPAAPLDWGTFKRRMIASLRGAPGSKQFAFAHFDSWAGGYTRAETLDWLTNGYKAEGLKVKTRAPYERSYKTRWNDWDGDPDLGRAVAGYDRYYFGRSKYEAKPAVTVNVEYYFSGGYSASTIQEFGAWLAQMFTALEQRGYSLAVNCIAGIYDTQRANPHRVELIVKRHGERADYTDWSAMFSPAGYRALMFEAISDAKIAAGGQPSRGLAGPFSYAADVRIDNDTHTLWITCGNRPFDRTKMDAMLKATGLVEA